MKTEYAKVIVRNGKNKMYFVRYELKNLGLKYHKTGKYTGECIGYFEQESIDRIVAFCRKNGLSFKIIFPEMQRDNSYRRKYFELSSGLFGTGKYQCAYCGKIVSKDKITVDHLIPIDQFQKNKQIRFICKWIGITNVNYENNLVTACKKCNSKKGAKIGLWTIRGVLGKHFLFWIFVWMLEFIGIVLLLKHLIKIGGF